MPAQNKNYMAVNRLKLLANGKIALDEELYPGINVLWGSNGSGKSTFLDLIYYALGGNDVGWKEVAQYFERVFLELCLGGDVVTVSRRFDSSMPALEFYWGDLNAAELAPMQQWVSHSPKSTKGQESYSDVLFSLLGWPTIKSDEFNSITMTQILRLIYGDQPSPPTKIFREANFDSERTKSALGDFILGAFNSDLYRLKDLINSLETDLSNYRAEVKAINNFLNNIDGEKTRLEIEGSISKLRDDLNSLHDQLDKIDVSNEERTLSDNESIREEFDQLTEDYLYVQQEIETLELDLADSAEFINTLQEHLVSLEEATTLRDFLSEVKFDICPSCLTPIHSSEPNTCHLCKEELTEGSITRHRMRARYELQMQLEESKRIRRKRNEELDAKRRERDSLQSERASAYSKYISRSSSASSAGRSAREQIFLKIGQVEERIKVLHSRFEIVSKLEDLESRVGAISGELAEASERLTSQERSTNYKRASARNAINQEAVWFLRNDLDFQTEFMDAEKVDINFGKEIIAVDGVRRFSDSGHVYLKNSVLLAILAASLNVPDMCMPSFLMLDGIEDKGMEVDRIHALQDNMLEKARQVIESNFQVIFTGTTISESIESNANIIGGKRFSRTDRLISL